MRKDTAPTAKRMTTTKVVTIQQAAYTKTGEEVYYFAATLEPNYHTDRFGRDVTELILVVDETAPIHMEVCFSFDHPKSAGQTALLQRVDETLKGQDYHKLIDWLNNQLSKDDASEIDALPGEKGFEPYYLENEILVSVHDPALPGVVLVEMVIA